MPEYIEREALVNILLPIAHNLAHEYGSLGGAVSGVIKHIESFPAVAPESLARHGKWMDITRWWQGGSAWKGCSVCGKLHCGKPNYCPNCGARMDAEE